MRCGKEKLVSLLMIVGGLYPGLAVFPGEGAEAMEGAATTLDLVAWNGNGKDTATGTEIAQGLPLPPEPEEEAHVTYYESEPLPYPKAGNGIRFLRESYAGWLDDNLGAEGVFSHMRWSEVGNGEWISKSELLASVG